jgi:hypothetical protein
VRVCQVSLCTAEETSGAGCGSYRHVRHNICHNFVPVNSCIGVRVRREHVDVMWVGVFNGRPTAVWVVKDIKGAHDPTFTRLLAVQASKGGSDLR